MNMPPSNGPRVLAIDDETILLEVIRSALSAEGFEVLTAASGTEGLTLYEKNWSTIDLVLLDYLMPDLTGDLVFESMQRVNPDVRVLLLTACDDQVAHRMFAAGLRGYIQKPFFLDDLIGRIREQLEKT
jgi:DNA-binding response OmpR family regulator